MRLSIPYFDRVSKLPLACINFGLLIFAILSLQPIAPLIVENALGGNTSKAALYSGVFQALDSLGSFFSSPILGILSDKYGRKPFLISCVLSEALQVGGYLFVFGFPNDLWILFVTSTLSGFGSATWGMSFSYVADISVPDNRSRYFGFLGAAAGLAIIFGPLVGGLTGELSHSIPLIIALGVSAFNLLWTIFILPESRQRSYDNIQWRKNNTLSSFFLLYKNKLVFVLCFAFCINQMVFYGKMGAGVLYKKTMFGWGPTEIGIQMMVFGIFIMIAQGILIKPLTHRFGEKNVILMALGLMSVATICDGVAMNWYSYIVIPARALASVATPVMQGVISKQYDPEVQGKLMNVLGALQTLSGFVGPLVFSSLLSYFTSDAAPVYFPQVIFYVGGGLELIALLFAYAAFHFFPMAVIQTPPDYGRKTLTDRDGNVENVEINIDEDEKYVDTQVLEKIVEGAPHQVTSV